MEITLEQARRWIAGETLEELIQVVKKENQMGIKCLISFLGEHIKDTKEVNKNVGELQRVQNTIKNNELNAGLSIKPSQLGLEISKELCLENYQSIINVKEARDIFIWIDMERYDLVESTFEIFRELSRRTPKIGICLQANLEESKEYIEDIIRKNGIVRLVKGIYSGPKNIKDKKIIKKNFLHLMRRLLEESTYFAIGTHDIELLKKCMDLNKEFKKDVEYQFLLGGMRKYKEKLAKKHNIADYVPYGKNWTPYVRRRLLEEK